MITILTQNKESVIDCKNISVEELEVVELLLMMKKKGTYRKLGKYPTKERAMEVLMEIWKESRFENNNKHYEMPDCKGVMI